MFDGRSCGEPRQHVLCKSRWRAGCAEARAIAGGSRDAVCGVNIGEALWCEAHPQCCSRRNWCVAVASENFGSACPVIHQLLQRESGECCGILDEFAGGCSDGYRCDHPVRMSRFIFGCEDPVRVLACQWSLIRVSKLNSADVRDSLDFPAGHCIFVCPRSSLLQRMQCRLERKVAVYRNPV